MTATLHLGVADLPYVAAPGATTGDVAEWLENKYHIMEVFFHEREGEIAAALLNSVEGAMEDLLSGKPIKDILQKGLGTQAGADVIKNMFMQFIDSQAMDRLGYPGVPTAASLKGVNHRLKINKGSPRPSFRDTGLYESSFQSWID